MFGLCNHGCIVEVEKIVVGEEMNKGYKGVDSFLFSSLRVGDDKKNLTLFLKRNFATTPPI